MTGKLRYMREEIETGTRPTILVLNMIFTGRKPDFERFKKAIHELAPQYGLEVMGIE